MGVFQCLLVHHILLMTTHIVKHWETLTLSKITMLKDIKLIKISSGGQKIEFQDFRICVNQIFQERLNLFLSFFRLSICWKIWYTQLWLWDRKFLKHYLDFWSPEKFGSHKYNHKMENLNNAVKHGRNIQSHEIYW